MSSLWKTRSRIRHAVALVGWLALAAGAPAYAQGGGPSDVGDVHSGTLMIRAGDGGLVPVPALETDVDIAVTGVVVRTHVSQRFVNPTDRWLEGVYVFPLPDTAAVDHLRMSVGPRVIEGQIRERAEARRLYVEAKSSGRKTALIEQERPNVFTSSVANIGPGEAVEVAIEYQDAVRFDSGEFTLRFPMVVARRYIPGTGDACSLGRLAPTSEVADADRITPPLSPLPVNPLRLAVELDPGAPLKWLYSPSHAIATETLGGFVQRVTLADDTVPADSDFVLVWAPAASSLPTATLLAEDGGDFVYALLMVLPPAPDSVYRMPRETIFVVDTSGSMAGPSLDQAKLAVSMALDQLQPNDRFNIIQFNSVVDQVFPRSVPADPADLDRARDYVAGLVATGGTEMAPALVAALESPPVPGALRQVVFMTDGAVGNEDALFAYIETHLDESRLFTVGIGSAPNTFFMRKAAEFGRGTFTYIGSPSEVSAQMDGLFRKLERPALADIDIDWDASEAEGWPARVPDLYAGEPLVVAVRLRDASDEVVVSGRIGSMPWQSVLHPDAVQMAAGAGISQLWARRKIEALMDSVAVGVDRDDVRRAVVDVAMEHHLVTSYTSLIAVDVTPTAPGGATLLTHDYPVNAAQGALPSSATPAPLCFVLAIVCACVALLTRLGASARTAPALRRGLGTVPS